MKKGITLIFLIILAFSPILVLGLDYQGVYDELNTTAYIDKFSYLIHNGSQINFNNSLFDPSAYDRRNASTYTRVDVDTIGGSITALDNVTSYVFGVDRDEHEYLYYDYGAGFFDNFTARCKLNVLGQTSNGLAYSLSWANGLGEFISCGDIVGIRVYYVTATAEYKIHLVKIESGVFSTPGYLTGTSSPFTVYLDFIKSGGDHTLKIYSDYDRTVLLSTLTNNFTYAPTWRYHFWGQSQDNALSGRSITFKTYDYRHTPAPSMGGYFTTGDLLTNTSHKATAILFNASIPTGSNIRVQVSNNNSTWVDSQNVADLDILDNGLRALNLEKLGYTSLYMNVSFTRELVDQFPIMYDYLVIHEATGGGSIEYRYGVAIVLFILGVLIGWGLINRE